MWLWMSMSEGGHVGEVKGLAHYGGLGFSSGDWACDGSYAGFGAEEGCSVCVCVCVCTCNRATLVAQWSRIRLPVQGTRVQSLVREDPTCCGATKPVRHDY